MPAVCRVSHVSVLGVGVAVPGLLAGRAVAVLGQQVGPVLDGLQVARIAGQLVGRHHARAELRAEVQLDEAVRVGPAVGLSLRRGN